jgi:hypothetical protein
VHNFTFLNDVQQFIYLLCSENTAILNAIGKFISISVMKNKKFEYIYCVVARFHFLTG